MRCRGPGWLRRGRDLSRVSHVFWGGDPGATDFLTRGGLDDGGVTARSADPAD